MFGKSKDGRGRTIWDIITGANLKDLTPLELQYHNPLKAVIGVSMSFEHDLQLSGINFFLEGIIVYEKKIGNKKFHHTDYVLRGTTLDHPKPVRLKLRVIPDEDADTGYRYELYLLYDEFAWDQGFHDQVLGDVTKEFYVNLDDDGSVLDEKRVYWRINDVFDPYVARVTFMKDVDKDGEIEESELERSDVSYWDYSRITKDLETEQDFTEYLLVEMDHDTRYFTLLRGRDIHPSQVSII